VRLNLHAGGDFLLTGLFAPLMVTTTSLHWLARPHVFGWLFLLGALLYAERREDGFSWPQLAIVSGATAIWANLHPSFLLAPVIALSYAASHAIRPVLWPCDDAAEHAKARWFLAAAVAAIAGSLLNPYGWQLHARILSYLSDSRLISHIAEFQSFNFRQAEATGIALTMAVAAGGAVLALTQKQVAHFLIAAGLLWAGLRSARVLPLVALLALPLANAAIAAALREASSLRPQIRRMMDSVLRYSSNLGIIDGRLRGAAFSATAALAILLLMRTPAYSRQIGFPSDQFPVAAAAAVDKLPANARIFAPDSYGGYLIYRFNSARPVYCDGRSDFYGSDFLNDYLILINLQPGWRDVLQSGHFTHALLPAAAPVRAALEHEGWTLLYRDSVAALLEVR